MKKTKNLALLFPFLLAGCGGGGGGNKEIVLSKAYQEQAGDVFVTYTTMNFTRDGESSEIDGTRVRNYSRVDSIPSKYNYSQSANGPFILETTSEDGFLDAFEYIDMLGTTIIDDDLSEFTNIEYSNSTGSRDPENVFIGDEFSFHGNETLFSSISGDEVGYEVSSSSITALNEEQLTVPSGVFNAVRFRYNIDITTSINDVIETVSGSGYMWYGTEDGFMLKLEVKNGTMTRDDLDLTVTFFAETVLQSYTLAGTENAKHHIVSAVRAKQFSLNLNPNEVFDQIHANLKFNTKEILEKKD